MSSLKLDITQNLPARLMAAAVVIMLASFVTLLVP